MQIGGVVMFFNRKKQLPKVSKQEFFSLTDKIKSHFLSIKDVQLHTIERVNTLHDNHNHMTQNIKNHTEIMTKWLEYFDKMHKTHNSEIERLKNMVLHLNNKIEENKFTNEEHIKSVVDNYVDMPKFDKEMFKKELIDEIRIAEFQKKPVINVNNDNNVNNDYNVTRLNVNNVITNRVSFTKSEKRIFSTLFQGSNPMSYMDLASSTGHSANTVKVYINSLKKKGIVFEEIDAPNGTKLYAVPNKEKVRKLYNF